MIEKLFFAKIERVARSEPSGESDHSSTSSSFPVSKDSLQR